MLPWERTTNFHIFINFVKYILFNLNCMANWCQKTGQRDEKHPPDAGKVQDLCSRDKGQPGKQKRKKLRQCLYFSFVQHTHKQFILSRLYTTALL
jgi:hypothetical protein